MPTPTASRPTTRVGLVLAAGQGSRMGVPKALLTWRGSPLLCHQCEVLRPIVDEVLVVIGARAGEVAALVPDGIHAVHNPDWPTGMASSLRAGVAALPREAWQVVIVPVDQPLITTGLVRDALNLHRRGRVVVVDYGGHWGHPMVWDADLLHEAVGTLRGDRGARDWLQANKARISVLPRPGDWAQLDLDTPEDLRRLGSSEK